MNNINIDQFVSAIISNNPMSVGINLLTLGYANELYTDTAYLEQVILDETLSKTETEAQEFLGAVLDVEIDPTGDNAEYLQAIEAQVQLPTPKPSSSKEEPAQNNSFASDLILKNEIIIQALAGVTIVFLIVLTIYLIKKI